MPLASGPEPVLDESWMGGRRIEENTVPQPLRYMLDPDYGGTPKAMYDSKANPVMRDDLVNVLTSAGVDNIQYFDAVLYDPESKKQYNNYKAFNIVGLVAAADMRQSELMGTSESTIGDIDFHALAIDESKCSGLLLFRLAEKVSAIVVHEKIKIAIDAAGLPGFVFYGPGEWSG